MCVFDRVTANSTQQTHIFSNYVNARCLPCSRSLHLSLPPSLFLFYLLLLSLSLLLLRQCKIFKIQHIPQNLKSPIKAAALPPSLQLHLSLPLSLAISLLCPLECNAIAFNLRHNWVHIVATRLCLPNCSCGRRKVEQTHWGRWCRCCPSRIFFAIVLPPKFVACHGQSSAPPSACTHVAPLAYSPPPRSLLDHTPMTTISQRQQRIAAVDNERRFLQLGLNSDSQSVLYAFWG